MSKIIQTCPKCGKVATHNGFLRGVEDSEVDLLDPLALAPSGASARITNTMAAGTTPKYQPTTPEIMPTMSIQNVHKIKLMVLSFITHHPSRPTPWPWPGCGVRPATQLRQVRIPARTLRSAGLPCAETPHRPPPPHP